MRGDSFDEAGRAEWVAGEVVLHPVQARRSVDRAVVCGACSRVIAQRNCGTLSFPHDASAGGHWRGWKRADVARLEVPGGYWRVADPGERRQAPLEGRLEVLPAVIECPFCAVPNLFEAKTLNVAVGRQPCDELDA